MITVGPNIILEIGSINTWKDAIRSIKKSLEKYYEIANATGDPKIEAALELLRSDCLGMENFKILMDEKLSVILFLIIFNKVFIKTNLYIGSCRKHH